MKTAYFISSRSCSVDKRYNDYLLHHDNMEEDGEIMISGRDFVEQVKLKARDQNVVKNFSQNKEIRRLFRAIKTSDLTEEEKSNKVNENLELLISEGIVKKQDERSFRKVYRLKQANNDSEWQLYGVHEIDNSDDKNDVDNIRPKWCDKLIDYILKRNPEVNNIHLFLHDQDIEGYSDNTHELINGAEDCCKRKLISETTKDSLKDKKLTIVFFKHTSPCVMDVIGPPQKSENGKEKRKFEEIPAKIDIVLQKLGGIKKLKCIANEEYKIISDND